MGRSRLSADLFDDVLKFCLLAEGIEDDGGARISEWTPVPKGQEGYFVDERDGKYLAHHTREQYKCGWMKEDERLDAMQQNRTLDEMVDAEEACWQW